MKCYPELIDLMKDFTIILSPYILASIAGYFALWQIRKTHKIKSKYDKLEKLRALIADFNSNLYDYFLRIEDFQLEAKDLVGVDLDLYISEIWEKIHIVKLSVRKSGVLLQTHLSKYIEDENKLLPLINDLIYHFPPPEKIIKDGFDEYESKIVLFTEFSINIVHSREHSL
jgi:hypothetical protein